MEIILMKDFDEFGKIIQLADFDKRDEFAYCASDNAWRSASGIDILDSLFAHKEISANDIIDLHNEYCYNNDAFEDIVECVDVFDEAVSGSFSEIYSRLGIFDLNDDYFWFIGDTINSGNIDDAIKSKVNWCHISEAILNGNMSKDIYELTKDI